MGDNDLGERYRRYIGLCNARRFAELREFVAPEVIASETARGVDEYIAGIEAVVTGFPDYHWDLRHLLVDGTWLAARLLGTGTHTGPFRGLAATGRAVRVQELAMYRTHTGMITRCWGDLGSTLRDELVSGTAR
ncbi:ester cyclase [Nocardia caishijiensis]|uniref:Ester cyclase n=1 Tax=Nocardia caishijiensis TaxID=184756 RepID=A0ABQ6YHP5_9NOCA|nr:ester cyclase [Nocardia caishijiensis]KAF0845309.1 putative ester cyclase [Nocardia caishijiensis]